MAPGDVVLLRNAWEAFARGDVEAATHVLDAQVRWHGAGDDEHNDGCHNRDEALAFIQRALADGVTAEAFDFRDAGDRVVVLLQTHQPQDWGPQPPPHGEVVTVRDGKVVEMIVYPTVNEALAAAGLDG
jgi:ketosteroid isomerase-like protein